MNCRICIPAMLALCLALIPAATGMALPADGNNDNIISEGELAAAVLDCMEAGDTDESALRDTADAAFVYVFWGGSPLAITDSSGTEVTLTRPLHRVVAFNGETIETLRSLEFPMDRIVGVDKYTKQDSTFFPEFAGTTVVGTVWAPDYEKLLSLNPDAVFMYGTSSNSSCNAIAEKLSSTMPSIRVLRFDCFKPATYAGEIGTLGEITGKKETAAKFLNFYNGVMDTIEDTAAGIPDDKKVTVYFESWNDYKTGAAGSGYDEKITLAGGRNIFASEATPYPEVDPEAVIIRDPEVVIKLVGSGQYNFGGYEGNDTARMEETLIKMKERPGWSSLSAVKNGRVHLLHNDIFGGPEFFIGTSDLAKWFYPEEFSGLDPAAIHRQYLTEFQHLEFDTSGGGFFAGM